MPGFGLLGAQKGTLIFEDREQAGKLLARKISKLGLMHPLVLAVPRGGVVTGCAVATETHAELDVVTPRKLRDPQEPELALGAVMHDGTLFLNELVIAHRNVPAPYLQEEIRRKITESQSRREAFRDGRPRPYAIGRDVLLVDDGVATGATIIVAARWLKNAGAARVIIAAPVMPADVLALLEKEAERVVCLSSPVMFAAVGQYYRRFEQVEGAEVKQLLHDFWGRRPA